MGLRSPLSFYCGKLQLQDIITNANLNRSYSIGTYGPLTFSIGSETKFENYSVKKGDENSYSHGGELVLDGPNIGAATTPGAQVFPGFSPTNEIYRNRQNAALYVDVENQPFSKLTFGIASRVEQYSDFGTALNGKASIRIEPYKWLAIRGSLSTGFRAPSLAQSFYSSTVTNFIGGLPYENGTFNVEHPISRALGATNLKPEESTHYSAGFSLQTLPNLIINSDWYLVYVHNRIFFTGNFTASNAPSFAPLFSSYGIGGARFFTNAVSTVTQGIDFSVKHTGKLNSKFIVNTNFTLNFNRVLLQDKINIPSQISSYADVFFDRSEMARITQSQPELRVIGRVKIHSKSYSFTLSGLYYGPITVVHNIVKPETDQKITNGTVVDAFVTYNFPKGLSISIGCNNLFNKYPEKSMVQEGDFFTGKIFPYHQFSAYGFTGGSIFISLSYDFSL
jgi:iron complex outermembrane receptor protein